MDISSAAVGVVGFTAVREAYKRLSASNYGGEVALITGAGTGIGREMALILAADGCNLVLWGRRAGPLKAVADEAQVAAKKAGKKPLQIRFDTVDVSVQPEVAAAAEAVLAEYGWVDLLINNAGMHYGPDPRFERSPADIEQLMATNTLSHFWTIKAFLPTMLKRDHGHIVTIGSAAGVIGVAGMQDYCASKFALRGMNEAMRMQLLKQGSAVRCTMVSPSYISTGMFEGVDSGIIGNTFNPLLTPRYAAESIITAAKRGTTELQMPAMVYTTDPLRGLLPAWLFDWISNVFGLASALDNFQQTRSHSNHGSIPAAKL